MDKPANTDWVVELKQVCKSFNVGKPNEIEILHNIHLQLARGDFCAVMGPSGSGKSTLLNIIGLLDRPTSGQLIINGEETTQLDDHALTRLRGHAIGFVFQHHHLLSAFTALENVIMPMMGSNGFCTPEMTTRAKSLLDSVDLLPMCNQASGSMSGGQQQRVAVARALVLEPSVLLFDEPLSNLDARLRRSMRDEIRTLQQRLGLTVAYVTHDQSEALAVSDQIIVMDAGTIAQSGSPEDLYERPVSEFVAGFMGEAMLLEGQALAGGQVQIGPLKFQARQAVQPGHVKAAIRPEAWTVGPAQGATLEAVLVKQAYLGSTLELTLQTPLGLIFVVTSDIANAWPLGATLGLSLTGRGVSVVASS